MTVDSDLNMVKQSQLLIKLKKVKSQIQKWEKKQFCIISPIYNSIPLSERHSSQYQIKILNQNM